MTTTSTIKSMATDDRPREKALLYGMESLADSELIAILLGSGTRKESAIELARRIYSESGSSFHKLARLSTRRLQEFKGIGQAKAITLAAALEIGRRRMRVSREEQTQITRSQQVYDLMAPYLVDKAHEEMWIVLMNQAGRVLHHTCVSVGGMTGTIVDPKMVMRIALEHFATRMILVHNHPSGAARPSQADQKMTSKIKRGAMFLDIELTDHIIIAGDTYYSFLDEGAL